MDVKQHMERSWSPASGAHFLLVLLCLGSLSGCYAPLQSPGLEASCLPASYRTPSRTAGPPLNFASLTAEPPADYLLGPGDVLRVMIPDLYEGAATEPLQVEVMSNGDIHLPMVGAVNVDQMNLLEAQQAITETYADGYLNQPRVNVSVSQPAVVNVLVLGEVEEPGVHPLPKYQNDIGHALAAAGGLNENAAYEVEVHRRTEQGLHAPPADAGLGSALLPPPGGEFLPPGSESAPPVVHRQGVDFYEDDLQDPKKILRIPFRGLPPGTLKREDVVLSSGDVVMVPSRKHEVFFVVGRLSPSNLVRFSLGDRERELGAGLVLPRDREIDVVTAVAMAGYIDPIESPTTVTVHRTRPNGTPLLIRVDLIEARSNPKATVLVEPGDIIYLNPDPWWYSRHLFERIVSDVLMLPYGKWVGSN